MSRYDEMIEKKDPQLELEIGQLFGLRAEDISTLTIFDDDLYCIEESIDGRQAQFGKCFSTTSGKNIETLKNKFLIFKYLGNGKCLELYTLKKFDIMTNKKMFGIDNNTDDLNFIRFLEFYNEKKNSPLTIDLSDDVQLLEFDDLFKLAFADSNMGHEEEIKASINVLEEQGKIKLHKTMQEAIELDRKLAYTENMIYDIEKGKIY